MDTNSENLTAIFCLMKQLWVYSVFPLKNYKWNENIRLELGDINLGQRGSTLEDATRIKSWRNSSECAFGGEKSSNGEKEMWEQMWEKSVGFEVLTPDLCQHGKGNSVRSALNVLPTQHWHSQPFSGT